ncbi:MAG: hypothetical protein WA982_14975 [Rubrobacteraceae bacterium]
MSQSKDAERPGEEGGGPGTIRLLLGRISSVLGILVGAAVVLTANAALIFSFLGVTLGAAGYMLGARRLGIAAIIVAVVSLVLGAMIINDLIPGLNPPGVDDNSP